MASLSSLITNITRKLHPKKGVEPEMTEPLDFMPGWELTPEQREERAKGGKKEQTVEDHKRALFAIARKAGIRKSIPKRDRTKRLKR